ncbi:MAG: helix-turn-helix transcriptional regulator [Verrucomicrobiae bacterium]|nr:helix-turn-helix transcriptional regulator [Verrucomicrobiae bacterium]
MPSAPSAAAPETESPPPPHTPSVDAAWETRAWKKVLPGWRLLHGSFPGQGLSVEDHDFRTPEPLTWARSFHPDSLEICLNLGGTGCVRCGAREARYAPNTMGYHISGSTPIEAQRAGGERHCFITIEVSRAFLRLYLAGCEAELRPDVRAILESARNPSSVSEVWRMDLDRQLLARHLRNPPVSRLAQPLWYLGRTLEVFTRLFFAKRSPLRASSRRSTRVSRDRVDCVLSRLRDHLHHPPSLRELGREAGCSAFHLSRTFSEEMGETIPKHLRRLRVERAAELLATGDYNVTEAAMEVGYRSLSHFTKTFRDLMGCCPGLYPHARLPVPTCAPGRRS